MKIKLNQANQEYEAAQALRRKVTVTLISTSAGALLLGVWLAWRITRSITGPVRQAVQVVDRSRRRRPHRSSCRAGPG